MASKCARKSKIYTLDEDIKICKFASSPIGNQLSGGELNRRLAATLKRTADGIGTRIRCLMGPVPGGCSPTRAATDNGVRLLGEPGNFTYMILDSTQSGFKFKRMLPAPTPVSEDTRTITFEGTTITGSPATLWAMIEWYKSHVTKDRE